MRILIAAAVSILAMAAPAGAQGTREEPRIALVIGNSTYRMEAAIIEFGRRLVDGGVGFFYYAGHGLQVRGRNYLVPIDAEMPGAQRGRGLHAEVPG